MISCLSVHLHCDIIGIHYGEGELGIGGAFLLFLFELDGVCVHVRAWVCYVCVYVYVWGLCAWVNQPLVYKQLTCMVYITDTSMNKSAFKVGNIDRVFLEMKQACDTSVHMHVLCLDMW